MSLAITPIQAPTVSPEQMAEYCRGRAAYRAVFPWFYEAVRDGVLARVESHYPDVGCIIGTSALGMERSLLKFPGRTVPLEWVAFSFGDLDLHDFHIGVLVDLDQWPATCLVGLHIMDELIETYREAVRQIDWIQGLGGLPQMTYQESVRESRWTDRPCEIDFSHLADAVEAIASRAAQYYLAAAPVAHGQTMEGGADDTIFGNDSTLFDHRYPTWAGQR